MSPPGPFVQPGDTLEGFLRYFWQSQISTAEREDPDFKHPPLPLARIKKVMKSDPDVKMISADVFISEVTARAYLVAEQHKRRTLAKADVARALSKSDQFDFLIDIVPREEGAKRSTRGGTGRNDAKPPTAGESSTAGEITAARAPVVANAGQAEGLIAEVNLATLITQS
ncbi:hypothetical protein FRC10_008330 [Ceratobasidium sp. 414]|nr:hypothetical protein FRC10_008330 [Ceratobasidium sp. 414]